jgi:polyisoprenoid-binding protein YceI
MKQILTACALTVLLAACSPQKGPSTNATPPAESAAKDAPAQPTVVDVPAGDYTLDKSHASLIFRVNHLGFSNYTARFKHFDAQLEFDPANLSASSVNVTVDPRSLETDFPDPATLDFNAELQGEKWLDAAKFPAITFRSTAVEVTGSNTLRITGDFSLHGVTRPLTLDATFNGGYAGHPMDPHARIGFSAHGTLKRSEFGIAYGIPAPGTKMGVSDEVAVTIETEFSGPPLAASSAAPAQAQK